MFQCTLFVITYIPLFFKDDLPRYSHFAKEVIKMTNSNILLNRTLDRVVTH